MNEAFSLITSSQLRFLRIALDRNVRFLVVGGFAVRYYGCIRPTQDLDLFVDQKAENMTLVSDCITRLNHGVSNVRIEDDLEEPLKIDWEDVDLLTFILGGEFEELWSHCQITLVNGLSISILSKSDLIYERKKSLEDPEQTERREMIQRDLDCLTNHWSRRYPPPKGPSQDDRASDLVD